MRTTFSFCWLRIFFSHSTIGLFTKHFITARIYIHSFPLSIFHVSFSHVCANIPLYIAVWKNQLTILYSGERPQQNYKYNENRWHNVLPWHWLLEKNTTQTCNLLLLSLSFKFFCLLSTLLQQDFTLLLFLYQCFLLHLVVFVVLLYCTKHSQKNWWTMHIEMGPSHRLLIWLKWLP